MPGKFRSAGGWPPDAPADWAATQRSPTLRRAGPRTRPLIFSRLGEPGLLPASRCCLGRGATTESSQLLNEVMIQTDGTEPFPFKHRAGRDERGGPGR